MVTFVGSATDATAGGTVFTNTASPVAPMPAGIAAGDVAVVSIDFFGTGTTVTLTGYTSQLDNTGTASDHRIVYTRTLTGSETSVAPTMSVATWGTLQVFVLRGLASATPSNKASQATSFASGGGSFTNPSLTVADPSDATVYGYPATATGNGSANHPAFTATPGSLSNWTNDTTSGTTAGATQGIGWGTGVSSPGTATVNIPGPTTGSGLAWALDLPAATAPPPAAPQPGGRAYRRRYRLRQAPAAAPPLSAPSPAVPAWTAAQPDEGADRSRQRQLGGFRQAPVVTVTAPAWTAAQPDEGANRSRQRLNQGFRQPVLVTAAPAVTVVPQLTRAAPQPRHVTARGRGFTPAPVTVVRPPAWVTAKRGAHQVPRPRPAPVAVPPKPVAFPAVQALRGPPRSRQRLRAFIPAPFTGAAAPAVLVVPPVTRAAARPPAVSRPRTRFTGPVTTGAARPAPPSWLAVLWSAVRRQPARRVRPAPGFWRGTVVTAAARVPAPAWTAAEPTEGADRSRQRQLGGFRQPAPAPRPAVPPVSARRLPPRSRQPLRPGGFRLPVRPLLATVVTDSDSCHGQDSEFSFLSNGDTGQGTDAGERFTVIDGDTGTAAERELSAWPSDADSGGLRTENAYWSGPLSDSDSGQGADGGERRLLPDSDAGAGTEAQVIGVWTYQPPFRFTGGNYQVVYQGRVLWSGPRPDRYALALSAGLASGALSVVSDGDESGCRDGEAPVLTVTLTAEKAVLVRVSAEKAGQFPV